jgi:hypothetical protein
VTAPIRPKFGRRDRPLWVVIRGDYRELETVTAYPAGPDLGDSNHWSHNVGCGKHDLAVVSQNPWVSRVDGINGKHGTVRMMEDGAGQRPKKRVKFLLKPLNGLDPSKLRQPRGASDGATRLG